METYVRLYNNQKTKNSKSLPPDTLSCIQIRRANYQSHYWLHCTDKIFPQLSLTSNGWNYNKQLNMMVPIRFDGPQFPPSIFWKKINERRRCQSMVMNQILKILKRFYHQLPKNLENQNECNFQSRNQRFQLTQWNWW